MKAIVQNAYGSPDVFELKEIALPVVNDDEVLVRVRAAAIHAGDRWLMNGKPYVARFSAGWPKPKDYIPGYDAAGKVETVGKNVKRLQPGDEVFGACEHTCAEYVCDKEEKFVEKPNNLTFEQAASVPTSACTALQGLRDQGKVQPGQKVLINGASGGVGTFAVQIAKAFGAEVTGVCSTKNLEMVRSIGADHVIDYTQEDFTKGSARYDLIFDNVASHTLSDFRRTLKPQGTLIPSSGHAGMSYIIKAFISSLFVRQQGRPFNAIPTNENLVTIKQLIEASKVKPVIDKTYPLKETADAFRYLDTGHTKGKIVITLEYKNNT